ncbi:MAG: hypothetical protein R6X27_16245, partial [Candidatus Desulfacyla sp.]
SIVHYWQIAVRHNLLPIWQTQCSILRSSLADLSGKQYFWELTAQQVSDTTTPRLFITQSA